MKNETVFNKQAVCARCGRPGACDFGGRWLCEECYAGYGSCCLEFGGDDLWQWNEEIAGTADAPHQATLTTRLA